MQIDSIINAIKVIAAYLITFDIALNNKGRCCLQNLFNVTINRAKLPGSLTLEVLLHLLPDHFLQLRHKFNIAISPFLIIHLL